MVRDPFAYVEGALRAAPEYDVACLGTSLYGLWHASIESVRHLIHSDVVYCYPATRQHAEWIQSLNPNIIDLNITLYKDGENFESAYHSIISEVVGAAEAGGRVAYASQGSPAFLAHTSVEIARRATARGLRAVMIPGISSLELSYVHLSRKYDMSDVQLYNCDSIAAGSAAIDARNACLLFNLARYASPAISKFENRLDLPRLVRLGGELGRVYPTVHPILFLAIDPAGKVGELLSTVGAIARDARRVEPTSTLFLPPLASSTG